MLFLEDSHGLWLFADLLDLVNWMLVKTGSDPEFSFSILDRINSSHERQVDQALAVLPYMQLVWPFDLHNR
jgi:hypothetical protein